MSVSLRRRAAFSRAFVVVASGAFAGPVYAQAQQWPEGPIAGQPYVLDQISITAERGTRQVLDVPQSVLALLADLAEAADPLSVRRGGTDLGAALDAALGLLEGQPGEPGAVLLLTDGEDRGGRGLRAARRLADRGIAVHAVGFGTARGSKIAVEGEGAGGEAFLRDRAGGEVVSGDGF